MSANAWLSDCERDELAADFGGLLTQPATIERRSAPTKDAFGGSSVGFTTTKTVCRVLALKSPREGVQGGQVASQARQQILLPLSTSINAKDRISLIAEQSDGTAGVRFEVITTDQGKTDAFFLTVDVAKVA